MKANEQGLTLEEQIMFAVLGIILVIAIGVLSFNYLSKHERKLEEPNTTETEKGEDKSIKDKDNTVKSVDNLKEESIDNSKIYIEGLPYIIETINSESLSKKSTTSKIKAKSITNIVSETEVTPDEGIGHTDIGEVDEGAVVLDSSENLDWTFNSNIVKESYANETIIIPTTVILIDGTERTAMVEIKNKTTGEKEEIINNEISLPSGEYLYYYTCNNITKELPLTVYNKLDSARIVFASVKDTYSEYSEDLKFIIDNSTITNNENTYEINIKRQKTINNIPLKVILSNPYNKVETLTNGISVSNDNNITDLNNNEFIIWLDLNSISLTKTNKVFLKIDGVEYLFNFNVHIENIKEEIITPENNQEENSVDEKNPEENKQTEENKPTESKPIEEKPVIEENKTITEETKETDKTKEESKEEEKELVEEQKEESKEEEITPEKSVEETPTNSQAT